MAAAALLVFGLRLGINYLSTVKPAKFIVTHVPNKQPAKLIPPVKQKNEKNSFVLIEKKDSITPQVYVTDHTGHLVKTQQSLKQNFIANNLNQSQSEEQRIENAALQDNNITAIRDQQKKIDPVTNVSDSESPIAASNIDNVSNKPLISQALIHTASYKNEQAQKSDNYVFYNITEEQFNKSKVGTFFKKIKAVIERKNSLKEKIFKTDNKETN